MDSKVILIIDDDLEDQEVFIEAVKEIDNAIVCLGFSEGEEALRLLKAEALEVPDLIFLDLNMPRFSGKECLVELKKIEKLQDVPIIIYSTSTDKKDYDDTKQLGASYFLTKPYKFDELRSKLKHIFGHDWGSASD